MKVLLTTCLLVALLPAVASLKCYQCGKNHRFSVCRHPKVVECAVDEDSCMDDFAYVYAEGLRVKSGHSKACVDSKSVPKGTYLIRTAFDIDIIGHTELCQRDLCNKQSPTPPRPSDLKENGRKCPACIALGSDDCEAQNTISCRGEETKCLYTSAMADEPEDLENYFSLQGCVTPKLCNIEKGELEMAGGMITNITDLKCTNASMSPSALEGFTPHLLGSLPFLGMKQRPQGPGN